MTILTTARLTLRVPQVDDFDAVYTLSESPEMRRFLSNEAPSHADSFTWLLRNAGSWAFYGYGSFIVHDRTNGALIGTCGVFHSYRGLGEDFDNRAEAGWIIAQSHWNQGYAREAMDAVLAWFDQTHGPEEIVAMVQEGNSVSEIVAQRLGFIAMRKAELKGAVMTLFRRMGRLAIFPNAPPKNHFSTHYG
ncbi:MAG: GNAT family N-acetyltransferase [Sphingomonadaceae bacterium]